MTNDKYRKHPTTGLIPAEIEPQPHMRHDGLECYVHRVKKQSYWHVFEEQDGTTIFRGVDEQECLAYLAGETCVDLRSLEAGNIPDDILMTTTCPIEQLAPSFDGGSSVPTGATPGTIIILFRADTPETHPATLSPTGLDMWLLIVEGCDGLKTLKHDVFNMDTGDWCSWQVDPDYEVIGYIRPSDLVTLLLGDE